MAEAFGEVSASDLAKSDVSPANDCDQTSVVSTSESAKCDDEAVSSANASVKCDFDSDDDIPLATVAASLQRDVVNASSKCAFTAEDDVPLSHLVGAKVSSAGLTPRKTPKKRRKASKVSSVPKVCAMCKHFKCTECAAWFKFKCTFKKHMLHVHHKYPCPKSFCLDVFLMRNICNLHYQTHCLKHHVCAKCNAVFKHQSVHACHVKKHWSVPQYPCTLCSKMYVHEADLKHHHKQVHATVRRREMFQCPDCDMAFKTKRMLGYHQKVHAPKTISCNECSVVFCHYEACRRHIKKMHT